jgi:hypothetical protein
MKDKEERHYTGVYRPTYRNAKTRELRRSRFY